MLFEKWQVVNSAIQNMLILGTLIFACYIGFRQADISSHQASISEKQTAISETLIDLQYAVSVHCTYNPSDKRLTMLNAGQGNVFFWGMKFDDAPRKMEADPRVLAQGSTFALPLLGIIEQESKALTTGERKTYPLELYVKSQRGIKSIVRCLLIADKGEGDAVKISTQVIANEKTEWPDN